MARLAINPADVTKVFLTHLHSDHIVSLPELYLFPWASQGRAKPLLVWGPAGTRSMVKRLEDAFSFDIHIRREVDERFSAEGIKVIASDIRVRFSQGVDLLIHDVGRSKQDPALIGPPNEVLPNSRQTRGQAKTIADHHTDGIEAGRVFERVKPRLAVFSHFNGVPAAIRPLVRQSYAGSVEFGEDLMTIDVGDAVKVRRFVPANR